MHSKAGWTTSLFIYGFYVQPNAPYGGGFGGRYPDLMSSPDILGHSPRGRRRGTTYRAVWLRRPVRIPRTVSTRLSRQTCDRREAPAHVVVGSQGRVTLIFQLCIPQQVAVNWSILRSEERRWTGIWRNKQRSSSRLTWSPPSPSAPRGCTLDETGPT